MTGWLRVYEATVDFQDFDPDHDVGVVSITVYVEDGSDEALTHPQHPSVLMPLANMLADLGMNPVSFKFMGTEDVP